MILSKLPDEYKHYISKFPDIVKVPDTFIPYIAIFKELNLDIVYSNFLAIHTFVVYYKGIRVASLSYMTMKNPNDPTTESFTTYVTFANPNKTINPNIPIENINPLPSAFDRNVIDSPPVETTKPILLKLIDNINKYLQQSKLNTINSYFK